MKKLVAKTIIGREYMHSKQDAFYASANSKKIADALNKAKYNIKPGETWWVYDYDLGMDMYVSKRIFLSRSGAVKSSYL